MLKKKEKKKIERRPNKRRRRSLSFTFSANFPEKIILILLLEFHTLCSIPVLSIPRLRFLSCERRLGFSLVLCSFEIEEERLRWIIITTEGDSHRGLELRILIFSHGIRIRTRTRRLSSSFTRGLRFLNSMFSLVLPCRRSSNPMLSSTFREATHNKTLLSRSNSSSSSGLHALSFLVIRVT